MCDGWRLVVLKMQVVNYNHIDKPEQKRCVRQLETCGFKRKLIILINLNKNAVCDGWRLVVLNVSC